MMDLLSNPAIIDAQNAARKHVSRRVESTVPLLTVMLIAVITSAWACSAESAAMATSSAATRPTRTAYASAGTSSSAPLPLTSGPSRLQAPNTNAPRIESQKQNAPLSTAAAPTGAEAQAAVTFDPGLANLNPDDDTIVGFPEPIPDCEQRLRAANVRFRPAQLKVVQKRGFVCGSPQVVEYLSGSEGIRFIPNPIVTCHLALALGHFEQVLSRTAGEFLGVKVVSVRHGGTYNCRSMARFQLVSEHSYANAIDLRAFGLSDSRTVSVERHFGKPGTDAVTKESRFLRTLAQRLFDENVFSVVVTRYFDELHRDHFHVDMAHYRTDGTR